MPVTLILGLLNSGWSPAFDVVWIYFQSAVEAFEWGELFTGRTRPERKGITNRKSLGEQM